MEKQAERLRTFEKDLVAAGLGDTYAASHAGLAADCVAVAGQRRQLIALGQIKPLPATNEAAADACYVDTANKLCNGLEAAVKTYEKSADPAEQKVYQVWRLTMH